MSDAILPIFGIGPERAIGSGSDQSASTKAAVASAAPSPLCPNPSLRIEGALGLVVIEFHDSSGKVASTIPTGRELEAYRRAGAQAPGQRGDITES